MYLRFRKCRSSTVKPACMRALSSEDQTAQVKDRKVRPFEDVPGPKSLPVIGTLYKYLPLVGEYRFTQLCESGAKKLARYGPLVREEIVPGQPVLWVFRPEDIAEIFRAEHGMHPERRSHLALLKYRKDRSRVYNTGGLLPTNGPDWWRLRREFQKVLSKPRNVLDSLQNVDRVVNELIPLCTQEKHPDFLPILSRLFLELTCLVLFGVRLHSLSKEARDESSVSSKLIHAAYTTNSAILKLDNGLRLWRFFDTPLYRKLCRAQEFMESVAVEIVSQRNRDMSDRSKESLLDAYLNNPALDTKDVIGMACDMLLAGIDTTTYSTAFALYHIATNPRVQEKLRSEAAKLLPDCDEPITAETLKNATYTKATIKETFRMNPISVGVGRILQTDVILGGYHIPKGTVIVTQNQVSCRLPEYFDEPNSFVPERWLRDNPESGEKSVNSARSVHPFLVLPFGHGPRSCIARRLAEQSMQVVLLRMSRKLRYVWRGEKLGCSSFLINKPDAAINMEFYDDPA